MSLVKADAASEAGTPPNQEVLARVGALMEEVAKTGVLLGTDGLQPSAKGKRVRLADGKVTVVDGPFIGAKELVAAYAFFQVDSMDEAVDLATRFLHALGEGEVELRPVFDPADFAPRA